MTTQDTSDHCGKFANALDLEKILHYTSGAALSVAGTEKILHLQPFSDIESIQLSLDQITEMRDLIENDDPFPLTSLPDLRPVLLQLQIIGQILDVRQLISLASLATIARSISSYFSTRHEKYANLTERTEYLIKLTKQKQAVEAAIYEPDCSIKDSASPVLARVRKEIVRTQTEARNVLQKLTKKFAADDMLREQTITLRAGRLVLMLKEEYHNRVDGLIHDRSASGRTFFFEPLECVQINNKTRQLESDEREEIERILLHLSDQFREVLPELQDNLAIITELDVIHAKAVVSRQLDAHAPILNKKSALKLVHARHPLLLLRETDHQQNVSPVVPLDFAIGDFSDDDKTSVFTFLISGPNAGGKTVAIKTLGLLTLMTLCGLHIPAAAGSEVPFIKNIFVDIGDRQSIEDDLSTFSSHMQRLVEILHRARKNDLVILDEIGSGTDPEAGAALAIVILKELTKRRCLSVVTTHLGVLKNFAQDENGVANGSMAFNQEALTPTYQFYANVPGASYAFEIASRLKLPSHLIAAAHEMIGQNKVGIESLLTDLQNRLSEQKQLTEELDTEKENLTALQKSYEQRLAQLKIREHKIRIQAVSEAQATLLNANATLENAVREIREKNASKEAIKSAKEQLNNVKKKVAHEQQKLTSERIENGQPLSDIHPGMQVRWLKQDALAIVLESPDSSGKVLVRAGLLRCRVPRIELTTAQGDVTKNRSVTRVNKTIDLTVASSEIDLRGMRVEEALTRVDKFLDDTIIAGFESIRIIHGKGTGALRQNISEYLKTHPRVKIFAPARMGEGDYGVTDVTLL